jgi:flagellar basal-body rod protein FlgF/flagellar basal-body rod protein FlgG
MENALLVGLSRQMSLSHELDIVANNIANIDTDGYKADRAAFSEFLMPGAANQRFTGNDRRLSFVEDRATWIDYSPGGLTHTGDPLNVAIDGKGYFVVQTPRGQRYTRDGAFTTSATGQLVTADGFPVLGDGGPITFQQNDHDIVISPNGIVTVREGASTADSQRGKLQLADFAQPQRLLKDGNSSFAAPNGVNPDPVPASTRVVQGAVEKSNVNAVAEMARMIQITRSYSDIAAILQQQGDQRRNALQQLSQLPTS